MKKMKKRTIIQLGHSRDGDRSYVNAAHRRGLEVVLVETPAGAESIRWGDEISAEVFDDVVIADPDAVVERAINVGRGREVVAVLAGFELFVVKAHEVRVELGLQSAAARPILERMRRKDLQRAHLARALPESQPAFSVCNTVEQAQHAAMRIGGAVVVKPVDSGGSSGVRHCTSIEEVQSAATAILSDTRLDDGTTGESAVLVEEAIAGVEYGVQGVVDAGGTARILSVTEKDLETADGLFMERRHIVGPPQDHPELVSFVDEVITALRLTASAFHMDVRVTQDDRRVVLIEAGARMSGAYLPRALAAGGARWAEETLNIALGGTTPLGGPVKRYVAVELLTALPASAVITENCGDVEHTTVLNIHKGVSRAQSGYQHFHDRVGVRISSAATREAVRGRSTAQRA